MNKNTDTWEKIIDPNYINAELIGPVGSERIVTIKDYEEEDVFNPKARTSDKKKTLHLQECKPLVLNKTNTKTLMKLFPGKTPAETIGNRICLYVVPVSVGGNQTTGIRIKEAPSLVCELCGKMISGTATRSAAEIAAIGKQHFGMNLCVDCINKKKEEQKNG